MRVVVLDREPVVLRMIADVATEEGLAVTVHDDPAKALAAIAEARFPVVLVRWSLAGTDAPAFVRALRAHPSCAVLALLGPAELHALDAVLSAGADDALSLPLQREALLTRLRVLSRRVENGGGASTRPKAAIRAALADPEGGEVVVRAQSVVARVYVVRGAIAWVRFAGEPERLEDVLGPLASRVSKDEVAAVLRESHRSRKHVAEVLVEWKLFTAQEVSDAMSRFIRVRIDRVLALPGAAALFLPDPKAFHGPRIELGDEALGTQSAPALRAAAPDEVARPALKQLINALRATLGAHGIAVYDKRSGACVAQSGADLDLELAWSHFATMNAMGAAAEDVFAANTHGISITRAVPSAPFLFVHAQIRNASANLGLVRHQLIAALREIALEPA
jgi:CheY-like chemotaxis protein